METAYFARYGFERAEQPIYTSVHRILGVRRIVAERITHMVLGRTARERHDVQSQAVEYQPSAAIRAASGRVTSSDIGGGQTER
jgi:hypothetical protein